MIIGLSGYAGVGKDTCGEILEDFFFNKKENVISESFAGALKQELHTFIFEQYGFSIMDCSRDEKEKVRDLLIFWGEKRRREDPDYWVKRVNDKIKYHDSKTHLIITDVRYKNEASWLQEKGGEVWLLKRQDIIPACVTERDSVSEVNEIADRILDLPSVNNLEELEFITKLIN